MAEANRELKQTGSWNWYIMFVSDKRTINPYLCSELCDGRTLVPIDLSNVKP
jgi:hypothetical protein